MKKTDSVFVPSRGFLFFYRNRKRTHNRADIWFSSPHGDFSFSIFAPFPFHIRTRFSSPHGDFSFSIRKQEHQGKKAQWFSSPHGDFSFSIRRLSLITRALSFSSPHGDFSFSIERLIAMIDGFSFRPLTGISLFLSYLIFPL